MAALQLLAIERLLRDVQGCTSVARGRMPVATLALYHHKRTPCRAPFHGVLPSGGLVNHVAIPIPTALVPLASAMGGLPEHPRSTNVSTTRNLLHDLPGLFNPTEGPFSIRSPLQVGAGLFHVSFAVIGHA